MLSIGKLAAGQASYDLNQAAGRVDVVESVGDGVDDYYACGAEARGVWLGSWPAALGLSREVDATALRRVLSGPDPDDGAPLRSSSSALPARTFVTERELDAQFATTAARIAKRRLERQHERSLGHGLER